MPPAESRRLRGYGLNDNDILLDSGATIALLIRAKHAFSQQRLGRGLSLMALLGGESAWRRAISDGVFACRPLHFKLRMSSTAAGSAITHLRAQAVG